MDDYKKIKGDKDQVQATSSIIIKMAIIDRLSI
jgi:hypothetical protein